MRQLDWKTKACYKTLEEAVSKGVDFTTKGVRGLGNTLNSLQKESEGEKRSLS